MPCWDAPETADADQAPSGFGSLPLGKKGKRGMMLSCQHAAVLTKLHDDTGMSRLSTAHLCRQNCLVQHANMESCVYNWVAD